MTKRCIHAYVKGRVQGVWFRATTQKKAKELNLTGWVKNNSDGCVECVACGDAKNLAIFEEWLWQGPQLAQVTEVISEETPIQEFNDFLVR